MASQLPKQVLVGEGEHSLPYSKGLAASALMVTGLAPARAYMVANRVEQELAELDVESVSSSQLRTITREVLRKEAGDRFADAYVKWQSVRQLEVPLIILIGGATGAGKSTIATQLATRLGITRVVSTDAVREVLRSAFTEEMFPTLYVSSFEADRAVRQPIPHSGDRLIIGFREQAAAVAVGAQALIDRAIEEGTDMILEGAHLVPGFLEGVDSDQAVVVPVVVTIDDEDVHRSHLFRRGREALNRPEDRYLTGFKKIRRIQKYMVSSASVRGVPTISNFDLDTTLSEIIDHIIRRARPMVEREKGVDKKEEGLIDRTVEAIRNTERRVASETVS
jgi:2-phosphoglycerate kinase